MIPKVYCFHEVIPGWDPQDKLMQLWQKSWGDQGWIPVVLRLDDAKKHPRFLEVEAKAKTLPTVNNPTYEACCFLRWCALAVVGGGMFTDFDVINYGFRPDMVTPEPSPISTYVASYIYRPDGCLSPGMVFVNKLGAETMVNRMVEAQPGDSMCYGRPHFSDMLLLNQLKPDYYEGICFEPNRPEASKSLCVHYANDACAFRPRHRFIESFRPL